MSLKDRFDDLKAFGETFTARCQEDIRSATGIPNFKCFVNDQFEAAFPEDHLMRDGTMMLSLRLSLGLKGFGKASVDRLKVLLEPLSAQYKTLRANFADSAEEIDFDWHVNEKDKEKDEGESLRQALYGDALVLSRTLKDIMAEK